MAEREIRIRVVGDSKDYERMLGRLKGKSSGLTSTLKTLGKVGFFGAGTAVAGFTVLVNKGFDELAEMQKATAQTNAVLKSTGAVSNVTAKRVDKLADSLSRMSGVDDELIQRGENLLLTFKNVRNELGKGNQVFDRATKSALNLSVAGFGSLESTSKMLGKALNDPVRGMTALGRAGVTFTEAQRDAIAAMVESNNLLGAQKIILREVESQVGGSAKAYGSTFPGAIAKLHNAFDGVTAALAKGMLPIVQKVAETLSAKFADPKFIARVEKFGHLIATKLHAAFVAIGQWFRENWPKIQRGFEIVAAIVNELVVSLREMIQQYNEIRHPLRAHKVDPRKMTREQYDALPGWVKEAYEERGGKVPPQKGPGRQHGGPVTRGMPYTVGERGPETFVPRTSGHIVPNGGGGVHIGTLVLPGVTNAEQFLRELQRLSRTHTSTRSGVYGGRNLATALG